jgi:hypothetical protein
MQDKLFDSLLDYWQLVVDELEKNLYIANKVASGKTVQSIGELNQQPVTITAGGFKVQISMPPYYQFIDEGVSGAKYNKGISRFKYTNKMPPISAIRKFMLNRGISKFSDIKSKRNYSGTNTKSGKRRDAEDIRKSIAFVIARSIFNYGLDKTDFYTKAINDKKLLDFESKLLDQYRKYIIDIIKVE